MRIKKKGFSLLELILVLAIASAVSFMRFQDLKQEQENTQAKIAGEQIRQLGEAVNSFISIRYDKLSTLTAATGTGTDPGPRTCSGSVCTITYQTLINEGLLPSSFTGVNINKSAYTILLKRNGTAPNYVINGLITTNSAWTSGNRVRYDLLGKAMQTAGVDSGMSKLTNQISGYSGLWSETTSGFSSINKVGLLGYRVGYDSSMYSVYLRRDGTLPMTGDLDMGGNDINNAANISASGSGNFGGNLKATGTLTGSQLYTKNGYGKGLMLGGDAAGNDYELRLASNKPLTIWSYDTSKRPSNDTRLAVWGSQVISGDMTVRSDADGKTTGKITTNGLSPDSHPSGWSVGLRTKDIYSSGSIGFGDDDGKLRGYMTYNKSHDKVHIFANGQIGVGTPSSAGNSGGSYSVYMNQDTNGKGQIYASGNISSGGTVSGQYLKPVSTSVEGSACTSNGLISKISDGSLLSCINGIWKSPVSLQTMTFMLGGDHQNYGDICQRHLNNNGLSDDGWIITGSDVCTEDERYCTIDNVKCYAIKLK